MKKIKMLISKNDEIINNYHSIITRVLPLIQELINCCIQLEIPVPDGHGIRKVCDVPLEYFNQHYKSRACDLTLPNGQVVPASAVETLLPPPDTGNLIRACKSINEFADVMPNRIIPFQVISTKNNKAQIQESGWQKLIDENSLFAITPEAVTAWQCLQDAVINFNKILETGGSINSNDLQNLFLRKPVYEKGVSNRQGEFYLNTDAVSLIIKELN